MVGSSAGAGGADMVSKATFRVVGGTGSAVSPMSPRVKPSLECRYNPTTLKISGGASWSGPEEQASARALPQPQFAHPEPRSLSVELFLDDREASRGDVTPDVECLFAWLWPRKYGTGDQEEIRPPYLQFRWGVQPYFRAYLSSVDVTYQLFRQDGTPVRASASVKLDEVPDENGMRAQNPTSGGGAGERTRVMAAGDTLQSVAMEEYGDPSLWRGLAAHNDLVDPLRVGPGTRLMVPSVETADALT